MAYEVKVTERHIDDGLELIRFVQTLDELDLPALIRAINVKRRVRKQKQAKESA